MTFHLHLIHHHSPDDEAAIDAFFDAVNMPAASIERWLATAESHAVDAPPGSAASASAGRVGERIVALLHRRPGAFTPDDVSFAREILERIGHLSADRPSGDVHDTPWRHALMNLGHDPLTSD